MSSSREDYVFTIAVGCALATGMVAPAPAGPETEEVHGVSMRPTGRHATRNVYGVSMVAHSGCLWCPS